MVSSTLNIQCSKVKAHIILVKKQEIPYTVTKQSDKYKVAYNSHFQNNFYQCHLQKETMIFFIIIFLI